MNKERTERNIEFSFDNIDIDIDISELEELLKKVTESLEFNFDIEPGVSKEKAEKKRYRAPKKPTWKSKKELL